jgi:hypothetical protein
LPIVGGLCNASYKAFREAAKELLFVWSLSLLPILLSSLIDAANPQNNGDTGDLWRAFYRNVKSGEIFIYANALLAPIGFILYKHNRDDAKFPNHISFMWMLWIAIPVSAAIFALQRAGVIRNQALIDRIALTLFSIALLMRYTSMVYDSLRVDFVTSQRAQEQDLVDKVKRFSEGN